MYWRRYAVSDIPVDDREAFDAWLTQRWREKDELLDQYLKTGRFPSDEPQPADKSGTEDGYINTEVKLRSFQEIGTIFVVLASLAMIVRLGGQVWTMRHVFLSQALEQRKELFGY
jgi:lysocardiolipin and lysophospholipid acyltransferase